MGRHKQSRKRLLQFKKNKRWEKARRFLDLLGADDHRRFYSRSIKYLLPRREWDSILCPHSINDHANLQAMLHEFNQQNRIRMSDSSDQDVRIERAIVSPLPHSSDLFLLAKRAARFTKEFMLYMRRQFPAASGENDRVTKMSEFAKMFKQRFVHRGKP